MFSMKTRFKELPKRTDRERENFIPVVECLGTTGYKFCFRRMYSIPYILVISDYYSL